MTQSTLLEGKIIVRQFRKPIQKWLTEEYQRTVLPFEWIRKVYYGMAIPRSPLLKLLKQQLLNSLVK